MQTTNPVPKKFQRNPHDYYNRKDSFHYKVKKDIKFNYILLYMCSNIVVPKYITNTSYIYFTFLGVCNHRVKFIVCFIGLPDRMYDARVFRQSPLFKIYQMQEYILYQANALNPLTVYDGYSRKNKSGQECV